MSLRTAWGELDWRVGRVCAVLGAIRTPHSSARVSHAAKGLPHGHTLAAHCQRAHGQRAHAQRGQQHKYPCHVGMACGLELHGFLLQGHALWHITHVRLHEAGNPWTWFTRALHVKKGQTSLSVHMFVIHLPRRLRSPRDSGGHARAFLDMVRVHCTSSSRSCFRLFC